MNNSSSHKISLNDKFNLKTFWKRGLTSSWKILSEVPDCAKYLTQNLPKLSALITERKGDNNRNKKL